MKLYQNRGQNTEYTLIPESLFVFLEAGIFCKTS